MIQLRKKYECKEVIEELDGLIKESVSLFDNFTNCRVLGADIKKIERFETIILDHLLEKTNFEKEFDSIKISYWDVKNSFHTIIYNVLCNLGKNNLVPTFDNFLKVLNDRIKNLKKKPLQKYTYYLPTRIEYQLTETELKKLKRSLKQATSVSFCKIPKKILNEIKSNNYKSFILNRKIILKFEIKARDYFYPIKILDNKIYSFIGALAFSNHSSRDTEKWMSSPSDMSITRNPIEDHLIVVRDNKEIVYPPQSRWQILNHEIQKEISLIGKETWNIHNRQDGNYKGLKRILDLLAKQDKKVKEVSEDSLKLYLEAVTEKQLEISFLKFWIITERILKQGGKMNDTSLLNILKKIIQDKYLKRMVDGLYKKRNDLVHEFKVNFISQQDRNLTKAIAESTMLFLINPPTKIKTLQELRTLIDNIFSSKEDLKVKKKMINKLIKLRK